METRSRPDLRWVANSVNVPAAPAPTSNRSAWLKRGGSVLGWALILLWMLGWVVSFKRDRLVIGPQSWVPMLPMIAGDFKVHIDHVARLQAAGMDPYHQPNDWVCGLYPYPPMLARTFAWVVWFEPATAAFCWQGTLALLVALGGVFAWRTRCELGLGRVPLSILVAACLYSTPVIFAVERGQSDPMILLPILAAACWLRRRSSAFEIAAGALLGLTAWLKYYPGLTIVALVAVRRPRAVAAFVVVATLIGVIDFDGVRESIRHAQGIQLAGNSVVHPVHEATHSILENWDHIRVVRRSRILRKVPAVVAAACLLLPAIGIVGRRIAQSPIADALLIPYLLWLTAAATFGLPYSNDYNLTPLPIAALAVWDRRDRWPVQLALLVALLWFQPFHVPLSGDQLLGLKLIALYGVGASLIARSTSMNPPEVSGSSIPVLHVRPRQLAEKATKMASSGK